MLILAGIFTSLIVCAVIDTHMRNARQARSEHEWMLHNRAMLAAKHRHPNGVGTWTQQ